VGQVHRRRPTGGTDAPPSPFPDDHPAQAAAAGGYQPAPETDEDLDPDDADTAEDVDDPAASGGRLATVEVTVR
jgi:hypothetical protein